MARKDYIWMSDGQARKISERGWDPNETYLRSLVANISEDGAYADGLSYGNLKRQGRMILGIARRRVDGLENVKDKIEENNIEKNMHEDQLELPFD